MKKRILLIGLVLLVLILSSIPSNVSAHTEEEPFVTDLVTWRGQDVGDISVWNDGEKLFIKFETETGWEFYKTRLAVGDSFDDIPKTCRGNPLLWKFEFITRHYSGVTEFTYEVDLEAKGWEPGDELFISAQATVKKVNNYGGCWCRCYRSWWNMRVAWGEGEGYGCCNWAQYFKYTLQEPPSSGKIFNLPDTAVKVTYRYPGAPGSYPGQWIGEETYFDAILSEVPDGYDVTNGDYDCWCVDSDIFIMPQETYEVKMYSSLSPDDMPWYAKDDERWDCINYMLNQDYATSHGANWITIQNAMWKFADANPIVEELPFIEYDPDIAAQIVADVEANGPGFVPGTGQWAAIVLDPNGGQTQTIQLTIIVVDP